VDPDKDLLRVDMVAEHVPQRFVEKHRQNKLERCDKK
jgi:hypothetical protein